jgi:7,8-dihydropterin-6-yl-methyl-4-(beta-D-ribofuranosyl)aminobenzene 5'-phosphate synthase
MVETALDLFPNKNIKAVFGGFHLIGSPLLKDMADSKAHVQGIAQKLMEYPINKIYTGHCTGEKAYSVLKEIMKDRLEYFATSNVVEID